MAKFIVTHGIRIAKDFVPETFGRLTTIGPAFILTIGRRGCTKQVCICACGFVGTFTLSHMRSGGSKSCGCLQKEITSKRAATHGKSKTKEYHTWCDMQGRCYRPNNQDYADYGGRGIGVWGTWRGPGGFELWFAEIGPCPGKGYSQDRKDVNKDYEPGNIRWATDGEQANNRRNNHHIEYQGKTQTLSQWAREVGLRPKVLSDRIHAGWTIERAFTQPLQIQAPKKRKKHAT